MLEISHVCKSYGAHPALKDVSFSIGPGELVGLFGENGAGKTTLMKSILGLVRHRGAVLLDGEPITRDNIHRLSFATCEHSFFPNLTPAGHRDFYRDHFPRWREKRFQALMEFFQLPVQVPRKLSTGQKNQFEVVLALCQGADYILMDEPFAGNDVFNREDFYKVLLGLLEPTATVLLSTHLLEEVEQAISRAVLLRRGELVGDVTTLELEERGETLMDYVKSAYHYRADRVLRTLDQLAEGEEGEEP